MARRAARVSSLGRTQVSAKPVRRSNTPLGPMAQLVTKKPFAIRADPANYCDATFWINDTYLSPKRYWRFWQEQARRNPNLTEVHANGGVGAN